MPYTRPWDPANMLLGSRDADEIDDAVRDFANDLNERFSSILAGGDPTMDPWQLGAAATKVVAHWSKAHIDVSTAYSKPTVAVNRIRPSVVSEGFTAYFPIVIPQGSQLTGLKAKVLKTSVTTTVQTGLHKIDNTGTSSVVAGLDPSDDPSPQDIDYGALSEVLSAGECFVFVVAVLADAASASSAALYSMEYTVEPVWGEP